MKKCLIVAVSVLFFSCNGTKESGLMEVFVDVNQNVSLSLSTIAQEIKAIELELTDESIINPDRIIRVLLTENIVVIAERTKILVFNIDGTFIRSIGSRGQGPGEFVNIRNIALDEKNKRLFVSTSSSKLICYDLEGNYIKDSLLASNLSLKDMNHINSDLLIITEQPSGSDSKGFFQHSAVFKLNNDLQIIDSCTIRDTYFEKPAMFVSPYDNFIFYNNDIVYIYNPDIYFNEQMPLETVLRDTLYSLKNNHLIPELKLKFTDNGIDGYGNKYIQLFNIYRSSQYVFAFYHNDNSKHFFYFCYDTKTGTGYNMQDGFTDDIHQIEERVNIRPLITNTDFFYYWHTHMKPDDFEEPNPTLYVGKLKK